MGCDDESLFVPRTADPLFRQYAAIGNSITAGFQSGGINDSTQLESYAVLLARSVGLEVGSEFIVPLLSAPGCPPPLVDVFSGTRVAGGASDDCALRADVPPKIHNVAVPGAAVLDILSNISAASSANPLTTLILGGRTQIEAVNQVEPTFVSVWIGNNDVLGAALSGDTTEITSTDLFANLYGQVADQVDGLESLRGAVLIGIPDVTLIPHLSPGVTYWQAAQTAGAFPPEFSVNDNCGPALAGGVGESTLVPFGYGFGQLIAQAEAGTPTELDCVNDAPVLTDAEIAAVRSAVESFNAVIRGTADDHGWPFMDPNPLLEAALANGQIPAFPNTTGADAVDRPFGDLFSRDGFHPSGEAHELIAAELARVIDEAYGTDISGEFELPVSLRP